MSRLFVRLDAPALQDAQGEWRLPRLSWVLLEDGGELISQAQGDGSALAGLLEQGDPGETPGLVLLIRADRCMLLELSVPGRSAGQIRRALPYAMEEFLASEIDDMHIAHGPIRRGAPVRTVGVERTLVAQWLAALHALQLNPVAMIPDAALLPSSDNAISVLFDEDGVLVSYAGQAAVVAPELLVMALTATVAEVEPDATATIITINGQVSDIDRSQIEQHREGAITWVEDDTEVPTLIYLARRWLETPSELNLLHGDFAPARETNPLWQRLRPVAALAGAWFLLATVLQVATAWWADYRADALTEEVTALYRDYFPRDQRVRNPYRQMAQHIGQRGVAGASFAELLGHLTAGLADIAKVSLRSLGFNGSRNELSAELIIARFDALDELKDRLGKRGLEVEIASAEQQDDGIHARLRIRSG